MCNVCSGRPLDFSLGGGLQRIAIFGSEGSVIMGILDRMERRMGWLAIPGITVYLVIGQAILWCLEVFAGYPMDAVILVPSRLAEGEIWRLFTFVFRMPRIHPVFVVFSWLVLWMMGTALEQAWGTFRYCMFLYCGWFLCVLAAVVGMFFFPYVPIINLFVITTVFLAFAYVYPDHEFLVFFVLPVKVKWLAMVSWAFLFVLFLTGGWVARILVLVGVGNFVMFLGPEIVARFRHRGQVPRVRPKADVNASRKKEPVEAFHVCVICGATDVDHPDREFVYSDGKGYCSECRDKIPPS